MTDKREMKKVVAIDGPSGSGKTTIAKLIAEELGFNYLDTGALYRAIALSLRSHMIEPEDSDDRVGSILGKTSVRFENGRIFLNDRDVSGEIRSSEIDHYSSVFSARKIVRDFLLEAQRQAAYNNNLVVEGRDTTTVVFPDAENKIFLDASVEERARRRYNQFKGKGGRHSLEEAVGDIINRDERDSGRDIAPLKVAPNSLLVDSSALSIEQVKKKILDYIRNNP